MSRQHAMQDVPPTLIPLAALSPNSLSPGKLKKSDRQSNRKIDNFQRSKRNLPKIKSPANNGHKEQKSLRVGQNACKQLFFDDQNDLDAAIYVNHKDYEKGSSLDVEDLLHYLTSQNDKSKRLNKVILETMYKREESADKFISKMRAATPDVTKIPSQVGLAVYVADFNSEKK